MKIFFCLRNFLPAHAGGTEVYVAALCRELQAKGIECVIVKPGFDKQITSEYFYDHTRVIEYPESPVYDRDMVLGRKAPSGLGSFEKNLLEERPDIIHFHEISGSNGITTTHLQIARKLNIPVFTTLHLPGYVCKTGRLKFKNKEECDGYIDEYKCSVCVLHDMGLRNGLPELLTRLGQALEKLHLPVNLLPGKMESSLSYPKFIREHRRKLEEIFFTSEKVFVLSKWFKKVLLTNKLPGEKMVLLDKALPHSSPQRNEFCRQATVDINLLRFVYLGRISPAKGLHILLEALADLESKNWSLAIYGYVEEESYLEKCRELAKKNRDKISWKGILAPEEVIQVLQQYDALIFPSLIQEMVGLVVMEAFAAKIPVIGSSAKGIAEQIKDGETGFLFENGNSTALRNILSRVIKNPLLLKALAENILPPVRFDKVALHSLQEYNNAIKNKIESVF